MGVIIFSAVVLVYVYFFIYKKRLARGIAAKKEIGSQQVQRNIYFNDKMIVDIANKEIYMDGTWYQPGQIKHWESHSSVGVAGGQKWSLSLYTTDPKLPIYKYTTMFGKDYHKLVEALRILDL